MRITVITTNANFKIPPRGRVRAGEGAGSSDLQAKQAEAAGPWPLAFPLDNGYRAGRVAPAAGSAPENRLEASKSPTTTRKGQEQTASREDGGGGQQQARPPLQAEMSGRWSSPWRGVRGHLPLGWEGLHPPGSLVPGLPGPETPGRPCPPRGAARLHVPGFRAGGPSPASRAAALGPGEAAHLAVAGARLVHEGAVLTGPHGGRGGMRGAPDRSVLLEARKLHPNCACRGERGFVISHREGARGYALHQRPSASQCTPSKLSRSPAHTSQPEPEPC